MRRLLFFFNKLLGERLKGHHYSRHDSIKCDITLHRLCRSRTTIKIHMDLKLIYSDIILHGLFGGLEQSPTKGEVRERVCFNKPTCRWQCLFFGILSLSCNVYVTGVNYFLFFICIAFTTKPAFIQ